MTEPVHSRLGASSAERWLNCPGSAILLKQLELPETDEPEYRALGIAAHELAAHCLNEVQDTWETIGMSFHDQEVDDNMGDAVQTYLDFVRPLMPNATVKIEARIGEDRERRPHPDFYGTVDFAAYGEEFLDVVDYKHGEGIVVEPDENPQMMYYAYGIIYERTSRGAPVRSDRVVRLTIVQPRAYHPDGPIRTWETTAGQIIHWAEHTLLPAMQAAEIDNDFETGKWCRFCPAKLFCPLLSGLFGAAAKANPQALPNFATKRIALECDQLEAVEHYARALKEENYRRQMTGALIPGWKLVNKQSKRVWKEGSLDEAKKKFGDEAMTKPELKTPAQIEAIGPAAKAFTKEHAYFPNTGLTVAPEADRRVRVKVERTADIFAHMIPADDTNGEQQ